MSAHPSEYFGTVHQIGLRTELIVLFGRERGRSELSQHQTRALQRVHELVQFLQNVAFNHGRAGLLG